MLTSNALAILCSVRSVGLVLPASILEILVGSILPSILATKST